MSAPAVGGLWLGEQSPPEVRGGIHSCAATDGTLEFGFFLLSSSFRLPSLYRGWVNSKQSQD